MSRLELQEWATTYPTLDSVIEYRRQLGLRELTFDECIDHLANKAEFEMALGRERIINKFTTYGIWRDGRLLNRAFLPMYRIFISPEKQQEFINECL